MTRSGPCALALACLGTACAGPTPDGDTVGPPSGPATAATFVDRSRELGIDFEHRNGMAGELYLVEVLGAGAALVDYDGDGDLDAYLVQGGTLGERGGRQTEGSVGASEETARDVLLRSDAGGGGRAPRFVDVTRASGLDARGYGLGIATGDIDNDGNVDLYVTNFGANQLWRNRGDGTFEEVTERAGVQEERLSTSAAFLDYDLDGFLDLYVANYVDFRLSANKTCHTAGGLADYCGPLAFQPVTDRLFHNRGDGRFEDVSGAAGILSEAASALGVVAADFDGDGWPDIYVANDQMHNALWSNRGDGRFENTALLAGCAVNEEGMAEASMGVDAADLDNDGDDDLFMTHLQGESNTLFENQGGGAFVDRTVGTGLGTDSLSRTGFGTAAVDVDGDGWLDLAVANGAVRLLEDLVRQGDPYPLHERNQLFRNREGRRFEPYGGAGEPFELSEVSRGLAVGDVDGDGDPDLLLTNNRGPARLLVNESRWGAAWLGLRLLDREGRDALGARAVVRRRQQPPLARRCHTDASYCSANDPRVLFGLTEGRDLLSVRVDWPGGGAVEVLSPPTARYLVLRQAGILRSDRR